MQNISNNDVASILFYLKTKGRKRGYAERVEIDPTKLQVEVIRPKSPKQQLEESDENE